jgi:hypothetical protein
MAKIYYPTQVSTTSTSDLEIGWKSDIAPRTDMIMNKKWTTIAPLQHRANAATGGLRDTTQSIIFTGFNIDFQESINGVQLNIIAQRNGRIADETIQLYYQGSAIGINNFQYETDEEGRLPIENNSNYGGENDTWGVELTNEMIQNPTFGVLLRFQSHPYYPHSSAITLDSISLTIY